MSTVASIASYLRDLDAHLHVGTETRLRLLEEVREHLEQDVGRLEAQGLSPDQALEAAIARFGTPLEVAARVRPEVAGLGTGVADGLSGRLGRALERAPLRTYFSMAAAILAANVAIGAWGAHHYHLHHLRTRVLAWPAAEVGLVAAFGLRDLLSRRGGEADRRGRLRAWDASHRVSLWALILVPISVVNLVAVSGPGLHQLRQLAGFGLMPATTLLMAWMVKGRLKPRHATDLAALYRLVLPLAIVALLSTIIVLGWHALSLSIAGAILIPFVALPLLATAFFRAMKAGSQGFSRVRRRRLLALMPCWMALMASGAALTSSGRQRQVELLTAAVLGVIGAMLFGLVLAIQDRRNIRDRLATGAE